MKRLHLASLVGGFSLLSGASSFPRQDMKRTNHQSAFFLVDLNSTVTPARPETMATVIPPSDPPIDTPDPVRSFLLQYAAGYETPQEERDRIYQLAADRVPTYLQQANDSMTLACFDNHKRSIHRSRSRDELLIQNFHPSAIPPYNAMTRWKLEITV